MTERVTITGSDLTVSQDQDPKRKRPARFAPSTVPATWRPIQDLVGTNPFWTDEANRAADTSTEPPAVLARRWAGHRIEG